MFSLTEPKTEAVRQFLSTQVNLPFSYPEVGASRQWNLDQPPRMPGYNVDTHREKLGSGRHLFLRATTALKEWRQFSMHSVVLCWPYLRIVEGEVCCVLALHLGFWSMNAARIVYTIEEEQRFGFAYGTLPGHTHKGEERFVIEQRPDNTVWYEVSAFSKPSHWMVKLGSPIARGIQRKFGPASAEALITAMLEKG